MNVENLRTINNIRMCSIVIFAEFKAIYEKNPANAPAKSGVMRMLVPNRRKNDTSAIF